MPTDIQMQTAKPFRINNFTMGTAKTTNDIYMETAKTGLMPRQGAVKGWEQKLLESPEVMRKATVAQLYFLDYYFQALGYLAARKERRAGFDKDTSARGLDGQNYLKEFKSYCGRERVLLRRRRTKLKVDQFHIIAQVGQGGYGEVYLARKQDSGEVCALKKMRKRTLHKMDEIRHVLVERDILTATKTPWLVRLLYAFQDTQFVYLAMEYVPGGDFRTLLNNAGVIHQNYTRFYVSEMFAGVNELHKLGYIHRDLKPENFLIDGTGHVKLTDFGLATGALDPQRIESLKIKLDQVKDNRVTYRTATERRSLYKLIRGTDPRYADSVVGSPDYMAPEVLRGEAYSYSVDYWSLGCILFEFLTGFPPFSGGTPEETWTNLNNWTEVFRRPQYDQPNETVFNMSDAAWDLITRLIAPASRRYSSLADVTSHSFFKEVDWDNLRDADPPYVPDLKSDFDTGYFDDFSSPDDMAKYTEVKEKQKNVDAVKDSDEPMGRGAWVGFTYRQNGPRANASSAYPSQGDVLATIF